jgi:putative membrane-bound dehydrogenase-like protein
MTVPPGFSVEVVAAEPDLVNPVAMCFDERGRIWVTESVEYPRSDAGPGRDRVKVLEDTDRDGCVDRVTVFADGLNIPSGIAVGYGGVWVANAPDILYLQDTDGDGRADRREVVVTGFGRDDTHELPNSLTWGPDGYLYGLNGVFNKSVVRQGDREFEFTAAMFRIHPRTRRFELFAEGTSNPWGIAFDPSGSAFVSACVIDHLWHLVETGYYHRQAGAYPAHTWKIESIVQHTHQKAAYCGLHYFDSDAYPPEYRDRLYMGNIHGGCLNVDVLERRGATYFARPAPDFLTANDAWFMPVAQKTGPDGCLYVLDWYDRYHCYQDARRDPDGIERGCGRLYRVRYGDAPRAPAFNLARETDDELLRRLASPNIYFRDQAQRLLSQRQDPATRTKLERLVFDESAPRKARWHALSVCCSTDEPHLEFERALLSHADEGLRAWGVRLLGNRGGCDEATAARIAELTRDPSPDVRLQVAIAARKMNGLSPMSIMVETLSASYDDPLIPRVVWRNLQALLPGQFDELVAALERHPLPIGDAKAEILRRALACLPAEHAKSSGRMLAQVLADPTDKASARAVMLAIVDMVREERLNPADVAALAPAAAGAMRACAQSPGDPRQAPAAALLALGRDPVGLQTARELFRAGDASKEDRLLAFDTLARALPAPEAVELARTLCADRAQAVALRRELLERIDLFADASAPKALVALYAQVEPELQPVVIEQLTERRENARQLVLAVAARRIPASAVHANQLLRMIKLADEPLLAEATRIWGTVRRERSRDREELIELTRDLLESRPGDPHRGQVVFNKVCGQCHKIYGAGQEVGPDITLNGRNSWEQLLSNVLDPSLVIGPDYQARTVATSDGRIVTGLVAEDGPDRVVLKLQGGKLEVIPRDVIDEMETSPLSLMPEDLNKQLSLEELADLFAFLALDKPPSDPAARLLPGAPPVQR